MKNIILIVILGFLTQNCHKKTIPSVLPMNSSSSNNNLSNLTNITYLALGDSYTIGESVAENERYPNQLAEALKTSGFNISSLKNIARTGWTTDELRKGIDAENIENNKYDMVSLLIGVNNQYRNRSVEQYKTEFTSLLNDAIRYANGNKNRVFVVSIPDYAFTPFGGGREAISKGIDEYNAANRQITEAAGIVYINITPVSREGLNDPSLVAADKLHPSAKQYGLWVKLMLPEVAKLLK